MSSLPGNSSSFVFEQCSCHNFKWSSIKQKRSSADSQPYLWSDHLFWLEKCFVRISIAQVTFPKETKKWKRSLLKTKHGYIFQTWSNLASCGLESRKHTFQVIMINKENFHTGFLDIFCQNTCLFTFLLNSTVNNLRLFDFGVPVVHVVLESTDIYYRVEYVIFSTIRSIMLEYTTNKQTS